MREILTDAQRAALTDETEFAAMVRAIRDVTGDDSIGADTSLRQFARYLLALDTRVRADAGKVGALVDEWRALAESALDDNEDTASAVYAICADALARALGDA